MSSRHFMDDISKMKHKIILFDGICNFCNYWVDFVIKNDKQDKFRFGALQSETGQKYLNRFGLSSTNFDTFILIVGENYFIRSTAAFKVVKELNTWLKIFYPLILFPKFLRDPVYNLIAKNRYKIFGRKEVCRIPSEEEKRKFI